MVKQLGLLIFFMTLSCLDLRWNELISIISTLKGETLQEEEINRFDYFQCCSYLSLNPVLLACHFQYRVEIFFKTIVLDEMLGKVKYLAIRVEFQLRGSPHIHLFLWILDAPVLHKNNEDEYVRFVHSIVKAFVPNEVTEPELFQLVTTYQVHLHSRSCGKYKSGKCKHHFGKFFTENTIVATHCPVTYHMR